MAEYIQIIDPECGLGLTLASAPDLDLANFLLTDSPGTPPRSAASRTDLVQGGQWSHAVFCKKGLPKGQVPGVLLGRIAWKAWRISLFLWLRTTFAPCF